MRITMVRYKNTYNTKLKPLLKYTRTHKTLSNCKNY